MLIYLPFYWQISECPSVCWPDGVYLFFWDNTKKEAKMCTFNKRQRPAFFREDRQMFGVRSGSQDVMFCFPQWTGSDWLVTFGIPTLEQLQINCHSGFTFLYAPLIIWWVELVIFGQLETIKPPKIWTGSNKSCTIDSAGENPSFLSLTFLFYLNLNAVKFNKHAFLFQFYSQFAKRELEHSCAWQADFILKPNSDQINKYPSKSGWIREDWALSAFRRVK